MEEAILKRLEMCDRIEHNCKCVDVLEARIPAVEERTYKYEKEVAGQERPLGGGVGIGGVSVNL